MRLKKHDINRLNPIYHDWFRKLWFTTTSAGRQELIDANQTQCLVRIKHPSSRGKWGGMTVSGGTEYFVYKNGAPLDGYGRPVPLWKKEGRLTREDRRFLSDMYHLAARDYSPQLK